jgi:predicted chitinase
MKNQRLTAAQKKAKAQKKLAEKKEKALKAKNEAIKNAKKSAKSKATGAVTKAVSSIPKPPIKSEKVLSSIAVAKQVKQAAAERKAATIQNIQTNSRLFKFPMKAPTGLGLALPLVANSVSAIKKINIKDLFKTRDISPTVSLKDKYCNTFSNKNARTLCKFAYDQGITEVKELAQFMAQTKVESSTFSRLQEGLYYTTVSNLLSTFGSTLRTPDVAARFLKNPISLANFVYARSNGNRFPGDGYKFRGRGFIQLTGRELYDDFGSFIGKNVIDNPDYLSTLQGALESSVWYWKTRVKSRITSFEDTRAVTATINPALKKLLERQASYETIYQSFQF